MAEAGAKAEFIGNADSSISEVLKAWIKPTDGNIMVCGLIGPGTSQQITAKYSEPFSQSTLGAIPGVAQTAGLAQLTTGSTSVSALNTAQVWEGNEPYTFNLVLIFYALANASNEVSKPLAELEKMMAPDVDANFPVNITGIGSVMGRAPKTVTICIGKRKMIPNCLIESMSTPLDKGRDKQGNLIRAEVTLNIKTQRMLTLKDVTALAY